MKRTFLQLISSINKNEDYEAERFVSYIMMKYLNNEDIFADVKTAIPLLDKPDLEDFLEILKRNK